MITYSFIIPVHNHLKALKVCLAKLKKQINNQAEIIVIDDGSFEKGAQAAAAKFQTKFIRLGKRGGAGRARNRGVRLAQGQWLIFIDSDVAVARDFFWRLRRKINRLPPKTCLQGVYSFNNPSQNIYSQYKNLYYYYNFFYRIRGRHFCYMSSHCFIIPAYAFLALGGFNTKIKTVIEDADLSFRLFKKNYQVRLDRKLAVTHLKEFSFSGLLYNDAKLSFAKAKHVLRNCFQNPKNNLIIVSGGKVREMYPVILNVLISPLIVLSLVLKIFYLLFFLLFLFLILNFNFFSFIKQKKGWLFLLKTIPLYFLDMLSAFIGVFLGTLDFIILGRKY